LRLDEYVEPIREYIVHEHLDGRPDLDRHTPLLEWGVIDSLALTDVLGFVEEEFDVTVPASELTPENLHDIEAIAALLVRLDAAAVRPA
jgi:2-hydroxymuconate-semialdehyde hydrolase